MPCRIWDKTMRIACALLLGCALFAGCARVSNEEVKVARNAALACIEREAAILAMTNLDLDTAARATLGRCRAELEAERDSFIDQYPGYRDYIEPKLRELSAIRLDQARMRIASARAARR